MQDQSTQTDLTALHLNNLARTRNYSTAPGGQSTLTSPNYLTILVMLEHPLRDKIASISHREESGLKKDQFMRIS